MATVASPYWLRVESRRTLTMVGVRCIRCLRPHAATALAMAQGRACPFCGAPGRLLSMVRRHG